MADVDPNVAALFAPPVSEEAKAANALMASSDLAKVDAVEDSNVLKVAERAFAFDKQKTLVEKLSAQLTSLLNNRGESEVGLGEKEYWDVRDQLHKAHSRLEELREK